MKTACARVYMRVRVCWASLHASRHETLITVTVLLAFDNHADVLLNVWMRVLTYMQLDEEMEDCTVEEVVEELPDTSPRYICFSYCHHHKDGKAHACV